MEGEIDVICPVWVSHLEWLTPNPIDFSIKRRESLMDIVDGKSDGIKPRRVCVELHAMVWWRSFVIRVHQAHDKAANIQ